MLEWLSTAVNHEGCSVGLTLHFALGGLLLPDLSTLYKAAPAVSWYVAAKC